MALEFLYSQDDIPSLVANLYDNGYYLSRSAGSYKDQPLSYADVVSALGVNLLLPGSKVYQVGKGEHKYIMQLISCGKYSHPCYVGKHGRIAGCLSPSIQSEIESEAGNLQKIMRAYLKKNGSFLRYNANSRMSCFFLKNYEKLEKNYLQNPFPEHTCRGVIRILSRSTQVMLFIEKLEKTSQYFPAIESGCITVTKYWADHNVSDICLEFLCDHTSFSISDLRRMILWISDNRKSAVCNQKLQMFAESPPMSVNSVSENQPSITIFIDNPWKCWINNDSDYSGRPIILWPE